MSVINFRRKEIVAKVVYYGPALSGKTTNVQKIHDSIPEDRRGNLTSLATREDRTLFFDYVPIHLGNIGGFKTKFQIFTVPGQVYYASTRRVVLQATDGVVFVADSSKGSMQANLESLQDLRQNLLHYDKHLNAIPFVIQYNKQDLRDTIPIQELENELNLLSVPSFPASAINGEGVLDTLSRISSLVLTHLKASIEGKLSQGKKDPSVIQKFTDEEIDDEKLVRELMDQIANIRHGDVAAEIQIVDDDEDGEEEEDLEADEDELDADAQYDEAEEDMATRLIPVPKREASTRLLPLEEDDEMSTLSGDSAERLGLAPNKPPGSGRNSLAEKTRATPYASLDALRELPPSVPEDVTTPTQRPQRPGERQTISIHSSSDSGVSSWSDRLPPPDVKPPVSFGASLHPSEAEPTEPDPQVVLGQAAADIDEVAGRGDSSPRDPLTTQPLPAVAPRKAAPPPPPASRQEPPGAPVPVIGRAMPVADGAGLSPPASSGSAGPSLPAQGPASFPGGASRRPVLAAESPAPSPADSSPRQNPPSWEGRGAGLRTPPPRSHPGGASSPRVILPGALEIVDVGKAVSQDGSCTIPLTVRDPGGGDPRVVAIRFQFDAAESARPRPAPIPAYIFAWLGGVTVLTLLALALGLALF